MKRQRLLEEDAPKPDYITPEPSFKTPSVVHNDEKNYNLWIGPMWSVSIDSLLPEHVRAHAADLTCEPNKDKKNKDPRQKAKLFPIFEIVDNRLYMPPWYAKLAFPKAVPESIKLNRGETMREGVTFTGTLRSHPPQMQAAHTYMSWLPEHLDCSTCIISLPCGYGKTVLFLALAAALNRVTLVLAHTIALVDQWIEEARRFLPDVRVGYIKDGQMRIGGVDIIVASVQSLRSHIESGAPYVTSLFERVGTVCMDEGHHAVASTFWQVLSKCPALYRFVLTATPRRKDGLFTHLQYISGPVVFQAFRRVDEVSVVCVEYVSTEHVEIWRRKMLDNIAMVNALCEDDIRTEIASQLAAHLVVTQGRRVVVVTPRVEHIHKLSDAITSKLQTAGVTQREVEMFVHEKFTLRRTKKKGETPEEAEERYNKAKFEWEDSGPHGSMTQVKAPLVGRVLAGMDTLTRDTQYEGHVVVASPNIMEEGVSYKQWDTLIDLNNSSDAEQVVGRILRECATKKVPLIIDFWINLSLFSGLFWKRSKYYSDEDFTRKFLKVSDVDDVFRVHDWSVYNRMKS